VKNNQNYNNILQGSAVTQNALGKLIRHNLCANFLLSTKILLAYCKTLYFCCILISRFWNVEISLHFNLAFSQCSNSIYLAFDGQTEFSWVFNFAILSYLRNSQKFDAREKCVLQYVKVEQRQRGWWALLRNLGVVAVVHK